MSSIFVSHAGDDRELVDPFVTTVLQLGCEVPEKQIFFSSRRTTGVPAGEDLSHYVRERAEESDLVIAIISPTFQTRPYCLAELGAAWGISGKLHPIMTPGMKRTDLDGVLPTVLIHDLADSEALDDLHDRVCATTGVKPSAGTWNKRKAEWLASVAHYASLIPQPVIISPKDFERARADAEGAQEALAAALTETKRLERLVHDLAEAKDAEAVRELLLPEEDEAAFRLLLSAAKEPLRPLPMIVKEAIWYELAEGSMPYANAFDEMRRDDIDRAKLDGWLREASDEQLVPNVDIVDVEEAVIAVANLSEFLDNADRAFRDWFKGEYGMSPALNTRLVWNELMGDRI